ncbi:Twinfilin-1 [Coemansia sp. RSA 552]|nr:Twinfilin-1 [Coemansia sp. RSA 552]
MSSITSGIAATPGLRTFLDEARAGQHRDVAVVRVQIRGEDLVETARKPGTPDGDLAQLEEYLDNGPAFFLLRASASTWYIVMWMPEGKVGVSNRMVYASSQSNLKEAVGEASVAGTLQFTTADEVLGREAPAASSAPTAAPTPMAADTPVPVAVSTDKPAPSVAPKPPGLQTTGSFVKKSTVTTTVEHERVVERTVSRTVEQRSGPHPPAVGPKPQSLGQHRPGVFVKKADPRLAMSQSELEHVDLLKQEDQARSEQLLQMQSRLRAPSERPAPASNPANHHANSMGQKQTVAAASGGFHSVTLPLSAEAKSVLCDFATNVGITVVELQIEANKCVTSLRSFTSTEDFAPNPTEPRFYVMRSPGSRAFVYSCPDTSAPRLRMVYSTASSATLDQIQALGCKITHRLSLFVPKECTLIAVAATIRAGQAQRVVDDKPVESVVNYMPSAPARSLPSRFSPSSTRPLDAFTDENGFRKAFTNVRPNEPAPEPFRSPGISRQSSYTAPANDAVDSSPNAGASAWGVQLKPSNSSLSSVRTMEKGSTNSVGSIASRFSQVRLAGEAGDDSPASGASSQSSPLIESVAEPKPSNVAQEPEIMRSSLPGLRSASGPKRGSSADKAEDKWDPWRSVSSTTKTATNRQEAPKSALQSSVYTADKGPAPGSIADFMGDITYPPLQQGASKPEVS